MMTAAATDFFRELQQALAHRPDYGRVYDAFSLTFLRCLDRRTAEAPLILSGAFAKTDYLLKELKAPRRLAHDINDTRARLRRRYELPADELRRCCLADLGSLCRFIAFICQAPIPADLLALIPAQAPPAAPLRRVADCLRVIVERWDDDYVYAVADGPAAADQPLRVCYARGNRYYDYDWTYLRRLFRRGAQLNLVRPREDDGIVYPELIIFEPDFLVNISTVAHCFTNYADSPQVELLKKLEPAQTTEPILLGLLAGQLLDEAIHQLPPSHTYAQSVKTFFRDHATSLMTVDVSDSFHQEARQQQQHIGQAIHHALPSALQRFNPSDGIVEPSFFAEMLGLQGRMDFLQLDFKVLLEQKSGKGAFPYDNFRSPRQTVEHYVQLLLYMAVVRYNFSDAYERNGRELHAFLLYSKYANSLLGLGFSPELIFRAFRLRNELAAAELALTRPGAFRILETLTPEQLNQKHVSNPLWQNFQRPQIEALLAPIRQASPTERAYYFRFLTFIANEHVMAKLGGQTKENSGFAATWHDSLQEKLLAGNIYHELTLLWPDAATRGRIDSVELHFSDDDACDMSNFRRGDIVVLYPYDRGTEPDARRSIVLRCTIEDITADTIRLALRAPQTDSRLFMRQHDRPWAIEHDFMEASFSAQYKAMHAFLSAPRERRDLLLLQRPPQSDATLTLNGSYGSFDEMALRVKRARDLFLIIGPPGTGKTSFGMLYTVREALTEPDGAVLLMAFTNRAVDEICSKLLAEGIDFIRIGAAYSCAPEYRCHLLSERVLQSASVGELRQALLGARVVVATTTQMNSNIALLQMKPFSLAVIDEASQILEPQLVGLLAATAHGRPAISKVVLIGDHKQLTAVVQQRADVSAVSDPLLHAIGLTDCRQSLFERLLRRYAHDASVTYMLTRQGRMHRDIAAFPNHAFYGGRLSEVPLPHQLAPLPPDDGSALGSLFARHRVAFIHVDTPADPVADKVNASEAAVIARLVLQIYQREQHSPFDPADTVGVIVPYRNQIAAVRNAIARLAADDADAAQALRAVTIDTVERFQGSQRRYIIYGFTVQKPYQLDFLTGTVFHDHDGTVVDRKLNVAMTRAKDYLFLVGSATLLAADAVFGRLIADARRCHYFIDSQQLIT